MSLSSRAFWASGYAWCLTRGYGTSRRHSASKDELSGGEWLFMSATKFKARSARTSCVLLPLDKVRNKLAANVECQLVGRLSLQQA